MTVVSLPECAATLMEVLHGTASSVFAITKEMLCILTLYLLCSVYVSLRVGTLPVLGVVVLVLGSLSLQHLDVHTTDGLAVKCVHGALGTVTVRVLRKAVVLSYTTTQQHTVHIIIWSMCTDLRSFILSQL